MPQLKKQKPSNKTATKKRRASGITVSILLTILLGIPTLLGLRARPSVSIEVPLDPRDVFSTPLIIVNDGLLDLDNVSIISFDIKTLYEQEYAMDEHNIGLIDGVGTIGAGQKVTLPFYRFVKFPVVPKHADFALIVKFRPGYIPWWTKRAAFRFVTFQDAEGNLRFQQELPGDALALYYKTIKEMLSNPGIPEEGKKTIKDSY